MKSIVDYEHAVGGDGATVEADLGVDGTNIEFAFKAKYPIAKLENPLFKVIDNVINQIEKWIPGDQTDLAAKLKAAAHAELIALIAEKQDPPVAGV